MLNDFNRGGVSYSFGISNDVSWDLDMAQRGYEVFMYDMTIDGLPQNNEHFHFFKEGIAGSRISEKSLDTLAHFVERNGHNNQEHMILKMDVEGAEWGFINEVSVDLLKRFDQIVFEFHNMIDPKNFTNSAFILNLIRKLNATHTPVHLHGNNCGSFLYIENLGVFPNALELTYANNNSYDFYEDENVLLPINLDTPNNPRFSDIKLGYWNKTL